MIPVLAAHAAPLQVAPTGGGLRGAVLILQARHAVTIDLEEPPLVRGVDYGKPPFPNNRYPEFAGFRFSYEGGAAEAVRAMVAAWEAVGGPGDYRVEVVNGVYRLIPTTRHDEAGRDVPWTPLLDCRITLAVTRGSPAELWSAAVEAVEAQCGHGASVSNHGGASPKEPDPVPVITPDLSPFIRPDPDHPGQTIEDSDGIDAALRAAAAANPPEPPPLVLPDGPQPARDVLDAIARAAEDGGWWLMGPLDETDGWGLLAMPVEPEREYLYNETPMFDAPPPLRPKPPKPR